MNMGSQEYLRVMDVKCRARSVFNSKVPFYKHIRTTIPVVVSTHFSNPLIGIDDEAHCTVHDKCPISQFCSAEGRVTNILYQIDLSSDYANVKKVREIEFTPVK